MVSARAHWAAGCATGASSGTDATPSARSPSSSGCSLFQDRAMGKIRHIAITAEDPFVTAELFKKALGLEEISRGDSDLAREVYLTDGYINLAIVCWKRTRETPNPYPDGYGLDHFGVQVEDLAGAEARARQAGAISQPP